MLPIPAPIIVSTSASVNHRRLFIPLIYLGATASLCYLFLFAFIVSNESSLQRQRNSNGQSLREDRKFLKLRESSAKYIQSDLEKQQEINSSSQFQLDQLFNFAIKRKLREENQQLALSSSPTSNSSSLSLPFERKKLTSLVRKKTEKKSKQHGTRRSYPTKVWVGHQNLNQLLEKKGLDGRKPSSEDYSHYSWSKDEQCKHFKVQFAKKSTFKPRALVSFPGSGNSWLRYMIECSSGYFTGSVFDDKQLFTAGLLGEFRPPNDGSTIVQKTHHDTIYYLSSRHRKAYIKLSELMFGYRGLLLIRNPYDALVSYWNYINTYYHHKGIARRSQFDDIRWSKFVTEEIPRWTSLITSWIENSQDYLIVFYEEIQKNPRAELMRILAYLDQRVDTRRLDCLMKPENLEGPFHRIHPATKNTSSIPLSVDLIPVTTTSQQEENTWGEQKKVESYHHHQNDELRLLLLDSKKHQQQHPQSPPGEKKVEEQKEDKILSTPSQKLISSTASTHLEQNQYTNMTTSSSSVSNDNKNHQNHQPRQYLHHGGNNHLNNSSILRLDLIIQDNIDKINRFFQQKNIPAQLHYSPRPATKPYFLHKVQSYDV